MWLTESEQLCFEEEGYLLVPDMFSAAEIDVLKKQLAVVMADDSPRKVLEKDQRTVRALHGSHEINEVFRRLGSHPRLANPAQQLLGSPVYIHQFKINVKAAFAGDVWKWHQDYIFWREQDGMQEPRAVNAFVFLDEVTEFNGPLYLVPRSHLMGVIDPSPVTDSQQNEGWKSSFSADLKFALPREVLADLVGRYGLVGPKGKAGTVLFTHCNVVHGSPPNMSPYDRVLSIVTYNSVENTLLPVADPRPEFLVSRDFTPIVPVADDALLTHQERTPALSH